MKPSEPTRLAVDPALRTGPSPDGLRLCFIRLDGLRLRTGAKRDAR